MVTPHHTSPHTITPHLTSPHITSHMFEQQFTPITALFPHYAHSFSYYHGN